MAQYFRVIYDYNSGADDDLPVTAGDIVTYAGEGPVTADSEWIYCTDGSRMGFVPANYVETYIYDPPAAVEVPSDDQIYLRRILRVQAVARGFIFRRRLKDSPEYKKAYRRGRLLLEFLDTERTYTRALEILMDVFYKPLLAMTKSNMSGITLEELETVFTPLKPLRELHKEFEKKLAANLKSMKPTCFGRLLLELAPNLQQYTAYVNNYNKVLSILDRCFTNSVFEKTVTALQSAPRCNNAHLYSFLITPVQRVPRYQLLLTELSHMTPESHSDYADIKKALQEIVDVAAFINESKRDADNYQHVMEIMVDLVGDLKTSLPPSQARRFVREGILRESSAQKPERCYWVLFTDAIVYTEKVKDHQFRIKAVLPVKTTTLQDVHDKENLVNRFAISTADTVYALTAESPEDKKAWYDDLAKLCGETLAAVDAETTQAPKLVLTEGYLLKQGEWNKAFQRRWFVLKDNNLYYYRDGEKEPAGSIPLLSSSLHLDADKAFRIVSKSGRTYSLCAESLEEKEMWANGIRLFLTGADVESIAAKQAPLPRPTSPTNDSGTDSSIDRNRTGSLSQSISRTLFPRSQTVMGRGKAPPGSISDGGRGLFTASPPPDERVLASAEARITKLVSDLDKALSARKELQARIDKLTAELDLQREVGESLVQSAEDANKAVENMKKEKIQIEKDAQARILQVFAAKVFAENIVQMVQEELRSQTIEKVRLARLCEHLRGRCTELEQLLEEERTRAKDAAAFTDTLESQLTLLSAEKQSLAAKDVRQSVVRDSVAGSAQVLSMMQTVLKEAEDLKSRLRAAEETVSDLTRENKRLKVESDQRKQQQARLDTALSESGSEVISEYDQALAQLTGIWTLIDSERTMKRMMEAQLQALTASSPSRQILRDTVQKKNPLFRAPTAATAGRSNSFSGASDPTSPRPSASDLQPGEDELQRLHRTLTSQLPKLRMQYDKMARSYADVVRERDELRAKLSSAPSVSDDSPLAVSSSLSPTAATVGNASEMAAEVLRLKDKMKQKSSQLDTLQAELLAALTEQDNLSQQIDSLTAELADARAECTQLSRVREALLQDNVQLQESLATARKQAESLSAARVVSEVVSVASSLVVEDKSNELQDQIDSLTRQQAEMVEQIQDLMQLANEWQRRYNEALSHTENSVSLEQLQVLRSHIDSLTEEKSRLTTTADAQLERLATLTTQYDDLQSQHTIALDDRSVFVARCNTYEQEARKHAERLRSLELYVVQLEAQLNETARQLADQQEMSAMRLSQYEDLRHEHDQLANSVSEGSGNEEAVSQLIIERDMALKDRESLIKAVQTFQEQISSTMKQLQLTQTELATKANQVEEARITIDALAEERDALQDHVREQTESFQSLRDSMGLQLDQAEQLALTRLQQYEDVIRERDRLQQEVASGTNVEGLVVRLQGDNTTLQKENENLRSSLQKQFTELSTRIESLQVSASSQRSFSGDQLEQQKQRILDLESQLSAARPQSDLSAALTDLQGRYQELEMERNYLSSQLLEHQNSIEQLQTELSAITDQRDKLQDDLSRATVQAETAVVMSSSLSAEKSDAWTEPDLPFEEPSRAPPADPEVQELQLIIDAWQAKYSQVLAERDAVAAQLTQANLDLDVLRRSADVATSQQAEFLSQSQSMQKLIREQDEEIADLHSQVMQLNAPSEALKKQVTDLEAARVRLEGELTAVNAEYEQAKQSIDDLRSIGEAWQSKYQGAIKERDAAAADHAALLEDLRSSKDETQSNYANLHSEKLSLEQERNEFERQLDILQSEKKRSNDQLREARLTHDVLLEQYNEAVDAIKRQQALLTQAAKDTESVRKQVNSLERDNEVLRQQHDDMFQRAEEMKQIADARDKQVQECLRERSALVHQLNSADTMATENTQLRAQVQSLSSHNSSLKQQMEIELQELRGKCSDMQTLALQYQNEYSRACQERDAQKKRGDVADMSIESIKREKQLLQTELSAIASQRDQLQQQNQRQREEFTERFNEVHRVADMRQQQYQEAMREKQASVAQVAASNTHFEQEYQRLQDDRLAATGQRDQLQRQVASALKSTQMLIKSDSALLPNLPVGADLPTTIAAMKERITELHDGNRLLLAQADGHNEEVAFLRYSLRSAVARCTAQQQRADSLAGRVSSLEQTVASLRKVVGSTAASPLKEDALFRNVLSP